MKKKKKNYSNLNITTGKEKNQYSGKKSETLKYNINVFY